VAAVQTSSSLIRRRRFSFRERALVLAWELASVTLFSAAYAATPLAAEIRDVLSPIERQLVPPSPAEIDKGRRKAIAAATTLDEHLASQAVGRLLAEELDLRRLFDVLAKVSTEPTDADAAALDTHVAGLRHILPGRVQQDVDRLRELVAALAAHCRRSPQALAAGREAVAALSGHLSTAGRPLSNEAERQVRDAYAVIAGLIDDSHRLAPLRGRLSHPNAVVLIREEFVTKLASRRFTRPVEIHRTENGTSITGHGSVVVDLSASLPPSHGSCRVVMHAVGQGRIDASAVRGRARVTASASPRVVGQLPIVIGPRSIEPGVADIDADVQTRLTQLSIDGLLGRCRLVRRVASRAVQQQLTANDPVAAREIDEAVGREVREQGLRLATEINMLLTWGIWERLGAIDFTPDVELATTGHAATSHTSYARGDQLAALTSPPPLPSDIASRADMLTQVHESAINNVFTSFGGLEFDEATVRALWEVQLKLMDDTWDRLQPARIASSISLAETSPLEVRAADDGVTLMLRPAAGRLGERPLARTPAEVRLHYTLAKDERGIVFLRDPCQVTGPLDDTARAAWTELVDLFFGRALRPLPRYQPNGVDASLRLIHASLRDGWLVLAIEHVPTAEP
jgi:hypothetical protein